MPVTTYHCLCTQLSVATTLPLEDMPKRQGDGSAIAITGNFGSDAKATLQMQNIRAEPNPVVLKLDNGFEKRYPVICTTCELMAGYHLDTSQFEGCESETGSNAEVIYVMPGGLMTTEEMQTGKDMGKEIGAITAS